MVFRSQVDIWKWCLSGFQIFLDECIQISDLSFGNLLSTNQINNVLKLQDQLPHIILGDLHFVSNYQRQQSQEVLILDSMSTHFRWLRTDLTRSGVSIARSKLCRWTVSFCWWSTWGKEQHCTKGHPQRCHDRDGGPGGTRWTNIKVLQSLKYRPELYSVYLWSILCLQFFNGTSVCFWSPIRQYLQKYSDELKFSVKPPMVWDLRLSPATQSELPLLQVHLKFLKILLSTQ